MPTCTRAVPYRVTMESKLLKRVLQRLPQAKARTSIDHPAIEVAADQLLPAARLLRDEFDFNLLTDITAIDWGTDAAPRFSGVYHLYSLKSHHTFRIVADCVDAAAPVLPSLVELWPAANWHERETYDMFGIHFDGHPDLRRILMWDAFPHFPLRKDFPLAGIETDLPAADVAQVTQARVEPAPMMGGPFYSPQATAMSKREPRVADQSWTEQTPKPNDR